MAVKKLGNINIVVIGHVDSGKSTTCGKILEEKGTLDPRLIEKYAKEANQAGKGSFRYAWAMDRNADERKRGITIKSDLSKFKTNTKEVTIIDAPGHRDFIKNMISGTSQADVAILIVSAAKGEFETGISKSGQTCEHAMLANTLGIKKIIVCVNKMDTTAEEEGGEFDENRFNEIYKFMFNYLKGFKYTEETALFVPISGFHGDNLISKSSRSPWYKGKTLIDLIDGLKIPKRPTQKPLRVPIQQTYNISGIGFVASGRVETGVMRKGQSIVFMPGNINSEVKSIEMHKQAVETGEPGDNVGFNAKNVNKSMVKSGMVVGDSKNKPPSECKSFTAQIIITNHNGQIGCGYSPVVHVHAAHISCKIVEMKNLVNKKTGKLIDKNPTYVKKNQAVTVKMEPKMPLVVESFKEFSQLGRFSLRDMKDTVGVGAIMSVEFKKV